MGSHGAQGASKPAAGRKTDLLLASLASLPPKSPRRAFPQRARGETGAETERGRRAHKGKQNKAPSEAKCRRRYSTMSSPSGKSRLGEAPPKRRRRRRRLAPSLEVDAGLLDDGAVRRARHSLHAAIVIELGDYKAGWAISPR